MTDFLDQISSFSPKRLALLAATLKENLDRLEAAAREPIAVIGLGCRVPGGDSPDGYWSLLKDGRDAIRDVPADRWPIDEYFNADPDAPGKMATRRGGFLDRIDLFDPHFFGIAPREALLMDPQQRILLEVSWESLEHAGIDPETLKGSRTGVFVGVCNYDYHQLLLTRDSEYLDGYVASGNAHSVLSGRVAYVMGLQGPALSIDTACSSSLVAIHTACQSLRAGETTLALAGGVNVICAPDTMVSVSRGHMLAADGRCKTFDAEADGFSRGEGCGMVVLKRLSDARRDNDRILALVRGSAVNQDGRSGGLTVPNGPAQEAVIRDALAMAGLRGAEINYVEAHGTGTSLGDPIEARALAHALGDERDPAYPLLIGSAKTNIGHLESAAGVAGFIKVVLALQNEEIPPHLNFKTPSPHIDWADLPIAVRAERQAWPRSPRPRRAGVSSFGFSGTNSHVILEEAPRAAEPARGPDRPLHCLTLSARNEPTLRKLALRYADALASGTGIRLADAAFTAATGRTHLAERVALIVADEGEVCTALKTFADGGSDSKIRRGSVVPGGETDVVFLYTGSGAQYPGMGRALYDTSPVYRDAIDRCDALLDPDVHGQTLKSILDAPATGDAAIHRTVWMQPAIFAVEYALTQLWRSLGVEPAAVIGHSLGEYAAACAAGVFTLEDGLKLVAERARLLQSLPPGGLMAALFAPANEVFAAIAPMSDRVAVAAINAPDNVVISGETTVVESVLASFEARGVMGQRLHVTQAMHSPLIDPILDSMEALARTVTMSPPKIPVAWNLIGGPLPAEKVPDALYWRRHMREPVRFADGIKGLYNTGYRIFLEAGPQPTLMALARQTLPEPDIRCFSSLRRGKGDWSELLTNLADLHVNGIPVDWTGVDRPYQRRRIALPTYPFERERYWAAPLPQLGRRQLRSVGEATNVGVVGSVDSIFYKIDWEQAHICSAHHTAAAHRWIFLADNSDLAERLQTHLRATGDEVVVVPAPTWHQVVESAETLRRQAWWPGADQSGEPLDTINIVYLGALDSRDGAGAGSELSLWTALVLLQAAAIVPAGRIWLVTRGAQDVRGANDVLAPDQAGLWGLGRTFAREHPSHWGGLIDLDPIGGAGDAVTAVIESIQAGDGEDQVTWRDGVRRVARLLKAVPPATGTVSIKPNRSYLVTGGLGGIGLEIAAWLAARGARQLVLFGRTPLPPRKEWIAHAGDPRVAAVSRLEAAGVTVKTVALDVSDPIAMVDAMAKFGREWPPLGGIIHAAVGMTASPLADMARDEFGAMFQTKVGGARLLDSLSLSQPIEFFIYFSTAAALFGMVQSAHYAASNAVLDALACRRVVEGRPALSVNWGTWQHMRVTEEDRDRMARSGYRPLRPPVALAALESLIAAGVARAIVADVDWPVLRAIYESRRAQPLLSHMDAGVRSTALAEGADANSGPVIDFVSLAPAGRREAIEATVRREVAQVVGLRTPDLVDPSVNLFVMGLDSLMAIELKGRLERTIVTTLPSSFAFNFQTVRALVDYLDATVAERIRVSDDLENATELLSRLPNMSGEEVDSLLASLLDEEKRS